MLDLTDDGFEKIKFTLEGGGELEMDIDVFKTHDDLIRIAATEGQNDLTVSARVAAYLQDLPKADHPEAKVKVSHRLAWRFFNQMMQKVEGLKKNDPCYPSANSPEPTDSPSGPIPGEE